jgi:hypothetical protein
MGVSCHSRRARDRDLRRHRRRRSDPGAVRCPTPAVVEPLIAYRALALLASGSVRRIHRTEPRWTGGAW